MCLTTMFDYYCVYRHVFCAHRAGLCDLVKYYSGADWGIAVGRERFGIARGRTGVHPLRFQRITAGARGLDLCRDAGSAGAHRQAHQADHRLDG